MKIATALLIACASLTCSAATPPQKERAVNANKTATAEQVLALIDAKGAKAALLQLHKSGAWQASVIPGIESGHVDWLRVAPPLHFEAVANDAEDLNGALQEALIRSPYAVLPLVQNMWWPQAGSMCLFSWDSPIPGGVALYVERLGKALHESPPVDVASLREECLQGIKTTLAELERRKGESTR